MATDRELKTVLKEIRDALSLKDAVDSIEKSNKELEFISKNIELQTNILTDIRNIFANNLKMMVETLEDQQRKANLESRRDNNKNPQRITDDKKSTTEKLGSDITSGLGLLLNPKAILATLGAIGLAFAGLRGFEKETIDLIKAIGVRIAAIAENFKPFSVVTNALGLVVDTFVKGISEAFKMLNSLLGPVGKIISDTVDTIKGGVKEFVSILNKLTLGVFPAIGDLIKGLFNLEDMFKGVAKIGGGILDAAGKFLGNVGKVLKPIGLIFSFFEGFKAYMAEQGDIIDKLGAGVSAFFGDMFGSFLDLIKNIFSWAGKKLGFENFSKVLDSFSFESLIKTTVRFLWDSVRKMVEWVGKLFENPVEALKELASGIWDTSVSFGSWVWEKIKPVFSWITGIFTGVKESFMGALPDWVKDTGFNIGSWVWEKISGIFEWFNTLFTDPVAAVKQYYMALWRGVTTVGDFILEKMKPLFNWIGSIFPENIGDAIKEKIDKVTDGKGIFGYVVDKFTGLFTAVFDLIPSPKDILNKIIGSLPLRIQRWFLSSEQQVAPPETETRSVPTTEQMRDPGKTPSNMLINRSVTNGDTVNTNNNTTINNINNGSPTRSLEYNAMPYGTLYGP